LDYKISKKPYIKSLLKLSFVSGELYHFRGKGNCQISLIAELEASFFLACLYRLFFCFLFISFFSW
ncbi:MAG TPA: hypothetical protein VH878_07240, partial [Thermodesulfobacteriota bacterium]